MLLFCFIFLTVLYYLFTIAFPGEMLFPPSVFCFSAVFLVLLILVTDLAL